MEPCDSQEFNPPGALEFLRLALLSKSLFRVLNGATTPCIIAVDINYVTHGCEIRATDVKRH